MKLKIGISPCPNDTFIFDAIYNNTVDCWPYEFEFIFEDVETLNKMAEQHEIDILKLSYAQYFNVANHYVMLQSGSALGYGVGPLLIAKNKIDLGEIDTKKIAIPGKLTTAQFLLQFAFPSVSNQIEYNFAKIEQAVIDDEVDAGVIIHENRFTYEKKGLYKLMDLGEYWESKTNLPIPLGGIAIKRSIDTNIQTHINELIQMSILFAQSNLPEISDFVKCHAQEMEDDVMLQHINLYVNDNTLQIDSKGIEAVQKMAEILKYDSALNLFID
jgi:1,4-dihydroxy-6-naphthoate synthase